MCLYLHGQGTVYYHDIMVITTLNKNLDVLQSTQKSFTVTINNINH